jgi:hypothetical protein
MDKKARIMESQAPHSLVTLALSLRGRGNLLRPQESPPPLAGGGEGEGEEIG